MTLIPHYVSRAVICDELCGARDWAQRRGWQLNVDLDRLEIVALLPHPAQNDLKLRLRGDLTSYKGVPPAWSFVSPADNGEGRRYWPAPGRMPEGSSSIFHSQPVICAPFNRLAYKALGGPHGDWGEPTNWLDPRAGIVRATTIGAMLAVIDAHIWASTGTMQ